MFESGFVNKPYVYKGIHKATGEFYIGYRMPVKFPACLDFGIHYFTSSNKIKELGFTNFDWMILAEFIDSDRKQAGLHAYDFEQKLIAESFDNPLCLNKHHAHGGKSKFRLVSHSEETRIKLRKSRHTTESKAKIGEANRRRVWSRESRIKASESKIGISHHTNESKMAISRFLTGRSKSEEHKRKISKSHLGISPNEEVRCRISETNKLYMNVTNGLVNERILKTDLIPDGFWRGMTRKKKREENVRLIEEACA